MSTHDVLITAGAITLMVVAAMLIGLAAMWVAALFRRVWRCLFRRRRWVDVPGGDEK